MATNTDSFLCLKFYFFNSHVLGFLFCFVSLFLVLFWELVFLVVGWLVFFAFLHFLSLGGVAAEQKGC